MIDDLNYDDDSDDGNNMETEEIKFDINSK